MGADELSEYDNIHIASDIGHKAGHPATSLS
jgi:hypothetical protein